MWDDDFRRPNWGDTSRPHTSGPRKTYTSGTIGYGTQRYVIPTKKKVKSPYHKIRWAPFAVGAAACLAILAALIGGAVWFYSFEYGTEATVVMHITGHDDQASGSSHKYLLFTDTGYVDGTGFHKTGTEVFEDTDAIFHGKTDSSDLYLKMVPGTTWRCTVYGWRNHFMSSYRDILDGCVQVAVRSHK